MGEPFKNSIHRGLIETMAAQFALHLSAFERERFIVIACDGLEQRELKERCLQICIAMEATFPGDFAEAADAIRASLGPPLGDGVEREQAGHESGITGWGILVLQEYVGRNGLQHLERSLDLLKDLTRRLTAEFGIRPFLDAYPAETLRVLQRWVKDPCPHVRRLVSEGSRPRLPWGRRLKRFIADPSPMLPLLECLKDDPSEYVRRSVANHLNDIAKDHPSVVCTIAERWSVGADRQRQRLIRHALRTLVKQGDSRALAVLGYGAVRVELEAIRMHPDPVEIGQKLRFATVLHSCASEAQRLVVDYAIHFRKANGTLRPKVFKGMTCELGAGASLRWERSHSLVPVTTRTYYPGEHRLEIRINGKSAAQQRFVVVAALA